MKLIEKNNKKGITLIALVITIIVLLILAGVSIAMLTGDNSLLGNAQKTGPANNIGAAKDEIGLAYNTAMQEYYQDKYASGNGKTTFASKFNTAISPFTAQGADTSNSKNHGCKVEYDESNGTITITNGGYKVIGTVNTTDSSAGIKWEKMQKINGSEDKANTAKTLVRAFKDGEIKIGDYITNYNSTLNNTNATVSLTTEETGYDGGIQNYKVDTSTTWRVLGLNEDGTQLVITTGSPIKKVMDSSATEDWKKDPYLYLDKAEGWYNTNDDLVPNNNILDKICAIYSGKYASSTRSMRIEDVNLALGLTIDKSSNKIYKTSDASKTALASYYGYFGQTHKYETGDYAPENYLKEKYPSKYSSLTNKKVGDTVNGSAYVYSYTDSSVIDQSSKLYEVLFKGTESGSNGKSYWLASSGAFMDGVVHCGFGPGAVYGGDATGSGSDLFLSVGASYARWFAVRPVVSLKSEVTVEDLSISSSGSEKDWTTTIQMSHQGVQLEYGQINIVNIDGVLYSV